MALAAATAGCAAPEERPPPALTEPALAALIDALPLAEATGVVVAVGDIADCQRLEQARATADIAAAVLAAAPDGLVITLGDHAYPNGAREELARCYGPTWGGLNAVTYPSPGNHDYETENAAPYFAYFVHYARDPAARSRGYYAFERFGWHFVSLNSQLPLERGSAQLAWLEAELAHAASECTLAYWHHPLSSSGWHGLSPWDAGRDAADAWARLWAFGAELVVNGHEHFYERFEPQTPDLEPHPRGIRQIIAGTGGAELMPAVRKRRNSVFVHEGYGVLVLALRPGAYQWAFVGVDGTILDRSPAAMPCHAPERADAYRSGGAPTSAGLGASTPSPPGSSPGATPSPRLTW
ncbi:MAG TPA: metallophosphoesterase [Gammaproteobacteria bacterium]